MKLRNKAQRAAEPTGDVLTRQREDVPESVPSSKPEPVAKPLVAFEPLPAETKEVSSRW